MLGTTIEKPRDARSEMSDSSGRMVKGVVSERRRLDDERFKTKKDSQCSSVTVIRIQSADEVGMLISARTEGWWGLPVPKLV
jgi:hypothetical protein